MKLLLLAAAAHSAGCAGAPAAEGSHHSTRSGLARARVRGHRRRQCGRFHAAAAGLPRAAAQPDPGLPVQAQVRRRLPASQGGDRQRRELHLRQRAVARRHPRGTGRSQAARLRVLAHGRGPQAQSADHPRLPAVGLPALGGPPVLAGVRGLVCRVPGSRAQALRIGAGLDRRRPERDGHRPELDSQEPASDAGRARVSPR